MTTQTMPADSPQQTAHTLPGWVVAVHVPYKDRKLGPYYVRLWKKNKKIHRQYIKPANLERVRAACERHRQLRKRRAATNKEIAVTAANLNYLLRMVKRSIKGTLRPEDHNHLAILETQGPTAPGRPSLRGKGNFMVPSRTKTLPLRMSSASETPDVVRQADSVRTRMREVGERAKREIGGGVHRSIVKQMSGRNTVTPQHPNTEPSGLSAQRSSLNAPASRAQRSPLIAACLAQTPTTAADHHHKPLAAIQTPPRKRKIIYEFRHDSPNIDPNYKPVFSRITRQRLKDGTIREIRREAHCRRPPPGMTTPGYIKGISYPSCQMVRVPHSAETDEQLPTNQSVWPDYEEDDQTDLHESFRRWIATQTPETLQALHNQLDPEDE